MHYIGLCIKFRSNGKVKEYKKLIAVTRIRNKITEIQLDWDKIKDTKGASWNEINPQAIIHEIKNFFIKYEVEDWSDIVSDLYEAKSRSKVNIMESIETSFIYSGKVTCL